MKKKDDLTGKDKIACDNLQAIMVFRNYTSPQLAAKLVIPESTMEKYRSGHMPIRNASASLVYAMSKALNVGVGYLVGELSLDKMEAQVAKKMSSELLDEMLHRGDEDE